jgi:hypothetical protein
MTFRKRELIVPPAAGVTLYTFFFAYDTNFFMLRASKYFVHAFYQAARIFVSDISDHFFFSDFYTREF